MSQTKYCLYLFVHLYQTRMIELKLLLQGINIAMLYWKRNLEFVFKVQSAYNLSGRYSDKQNLHFFSR